MGANQNGPNPNVACNYLFSPVDEIPFRKTELLLWFLYQMDWAQKSSSRENQGQEKKNFCFHLLLKLMSCSIRGDSELAYKISPRFNNVRCY